MSQTSSCPMDPAHSHPESSNSMSTPHRSGDGGLGETLGAPRWAILDLESQNLRLTLPIPNTYKD